MGIFETNRTPQEDFIRGSLIDAIRKESSYDCYNNSYISSAINSIHGLIRFDALRNSQSDAPIVTANLVKLLTVAAQASRSIQHSNIKSK